MEFYGWTPLRLRAVAQKLRLAAVPVPCAAREAFLLEALAAARDVLATFAKQAGYLPLQDAYSTRMTEGQWMLARAVADIDAILAAPVPCAASPADPPSVTGTLSERAYQEPVERMVQTIIEGLTPPTIEQRIAQWRSFTTFTPGNLYEEGRAFAFERCADEAELVLRATGEGAPPKLGEQLGLSGHLLVVPDEYEVGEGARDEQAPETDVLIAALRAHQQHCNREGSVVMALLLGQAAAEISRLRGEAAVRPDVTTTGSSYCCARCSVAFSHIPATMTYVFCSTACLEHWRAVVRVEGVEAAGRVELCTCSVVTGGHIAASPACPIHRPAEDQPR